MRTYLYVLFLAAVLAAPLTAADIRQDVAAIHRQLEPIEQHARDYPPRFTSATQRKEIEASLRATLGRVDALLENNPDNPRVLLLAGFGHAMGHNLDFVGSAEKSRAHYARLIELRPEDPEARMYYGIFLNGIGRAKDAVPHLTKAVELGWISANYPLALSYVMQGNREQAIPPLKLYVQTHAKDEGAQRLLKTLLNKDTKIERKDGPPPGTK